MEKMHKITSIISLVIISLFICACDNNLRGGAIEVTTLPNTISTAPTTTTLPPPTYDIYINSLPEGADIFFGGVNMGATPKNFTGMTEQYIVVKISKQGYEEYSVNAMFLPGDIYYITPTLNPE